MIVDASALCAIVFREPERVPFARAISAANTWMSPIQVWEASVSAQLRRPDGAEIVKATMARLQIGVANLGAREAVLAFAAWERFGKGRHPAGLNLGDCFAYALAKSRDLPLLYKGDDFARTDVTAAL